MTIAGENKTPPNSIIKAIATYDRSGLAGRLSEAEEQRSEILQRFPKADWPTLSLENYALGQRNSEDTYCRWLEFRSNELGSMSGGSAMKMVIFKRREQDGWYYPEQHFQSLDEAWTTLRSSFAEAFRLGEAGEWEAIDLLPALENGPALKVKSLHVYFPSEILPIYSRDALRHFLRALGDDDSETRTLNRVVLNRRLLKRLRAIPELTNWTTNELGFFLYDVLNPREVRRVVKIAPGENAKFWDECLRGSFICLGWGDIGDLNTFENKSAFKAQFEVRYGSKYNGHRPKISAKANELWTLMELEPGDIIVANQGTSKVLAVGEVMQPGYEWRADRTEYRHTARVKWDTSVAQTIEPQPAWATVTVGKVPSSLYEAIMRGQPAVQSGNAPQPLTVAQALDPLLAGLMDTLDRKGQLILYGPPGTGKTFTARHLSVAFQLRHAGEEVASVLADPAKFNAAEHALSQATSTSVAPIVRLTFHPSYAYEDFIEGFRPYQGKDDTLALRLEDGVFKRVCNEAHANPDHRYVVLIDEINRANIGKVFGEVITLIERDKRSLLVTLPQSKQSFSIPPNVYIIGTMNTADRSIKLLDAALRRRFAFAEVMPDSDTLRGANVGMMALDEFLDELNRRITKEAGREKQVGHSFLLEDGKPISDPTEFARRFRQEILPLLQEYCYEDYATLAQYIGDEIVDQEAGTLDMDRINDPESLIAALQKAFAAAPALAE